MKTDNTQIQVQCTKCKRTYDTTIGSYDKRLGWLCPACRKEGQR